MPTPEGRYAVVPDPANPGRWRVQNTTTKNLVGPSFRSQRVAQRSADRRNEGGPDTR